MPTKKILELEIKKASDLVNTLTKKAGELSIVYLDASRNGLPETATRKEEYFRARENANDARFELHILMKSR